MSRYNLYPKAFDIKISKTKINEANMMMVRLSVKRTNEFNKLLKLAKHKRFRIAKKNAKRVAGLLDAEFYKDKDGKWTIDLSRVMSRWT